MRHLSSIVVLGLSVALCSCESSKDSQGLGNAERREMARRQAAQEATTDEAQANLMRAQQNTVNRDGNAGRDLTRY